MGKQVDCICLLHTTTRTEQHKNGTINDLYSDRCTISSPMAMTKMTSEFLTTPSRKLSQHVIRCFRPVSFEKPLSDQPAHQEEITRSAFSKSWTSCQNYALTVVGTGKHSRSPDGRGGAVPAGRWVCYGTPAPLTVPVAGSSLTERTFLPAPSQAPAQDRKILRRSGRGIRRNARGTTVAKDRQMDRAGRTENGGSGTGLSESPRSRPQ